MIKYLMINDSGQCFGFSENPNDYYPKYDFSTSNVSFEDFCSNMRAYDYVDGELVLNENTLVQQDVDNKQKELENLKTHREYLFKKYIDRSPMYYNSLSNEQRIELEKWYKAWCDMPELFEQGTWVEPEMPTWL